MKKIIQRRKKLASNKKQQQSFEKLRQTQSEIEIQMAITTLTF